MGLLLVVLSAIAFVNLHTRGNIVTMSMPAHKSMTLAYTGSDVIVFALMSTSLLQVRKVQSQVALQ